MTKTLNRIITTTAAIACIIITSCGPNDGKASDGHTPDPEATAAGIRAAQTVINLRGDENVMHDSLLEIRAEIYRIHTDKGPVAASDFEEAFEKYIRENCDSLARVLL